MHEREEINDDWRYEIIVGRRSIDKGIAHGRRDDRTVAG